MSLDSKRDVAALERLSALADGELDAEATAQACGHWRESDEARVSWHAYQVIGDVLRSDDLAGDAARDATFLKALRLRMQDEPVVLAPQPSVSAAAGNVRSIRRRSWMAPSAVAAGFVAVVGVVMLTRGPAETPAVASLAQVAPVAAPIAAATAASPVVVLAEAPALVANGKLIRDARLDRYLAAHKQFAGSSALGVPSGYLRNATALEGER